MMAVSDYLPVGRYEYVDAPEPRFIWAPDLLPQFSGIPVKFRSRSMPEYFRYRRYMLSHGDSGWCVGELMKNFSADRTCELLNIYQAMPLRLPS